MCSKVTQEKSSAAVVGISLVATHNRNKDSFFQHGLRGGVAVLLHSHIYHPAPPACLCAIGFVSEFLEVFHQFVCSLDLLCPHFIHLSSTDEIMFKQMFWANRNQRPTGITDDKELRQPLLSGVGVKDVETRHWVLFSVRETVVAKDHCSLFYSTFPFPLRSEPIMEIYQVLALPAAL